MTKWEERTEILAQISRRQLFFIGGAPRSGTTWVQQILDTHPDIVCRGEGLFKKQLAEPIERMIASHRLAVEEKNKSLFKHTGGYTPPDDEIGDHLLRTAILLSLHQQCRHVDAQAIGEKTPENVFLFGKLKALFPHAKLIGVARDPRDVIASAWDFFHKLSPEDDEASAKLRFISLSLPLISNGIVTLLNLRNEFPDDVYIITYEQLLDKPTEKLTELLSFLGVSTQSRIVEHCISENAFDKRTGTRQPGTINKGEFFRSGKAGTWPLTFTEDMNAMMLKEIGWMFPLFGWNK